MNSVPTAARRILGACLLAAALAGVSACTKNPSPPPQPYMAFVADSLSDAVAVVGLREMRLLTSVPVPSPTELKVRPGSQEVWALSKTGTASVISYPELRVSRKVSVGGSAASLVFSRDGREAYVLDPARGDLVFVDAEAGKESARVHLIQGIKYLALTPDGKTLVISETDQNRLAFVDVGSRKLAGTTETGKAPGPVAILPNSGQVFVADMGEKKISVADVDERKLLVNLETGYTPLGLVLKPDGGELFALSSDSTLVILDAFHDDVEQNASIGVGPASALIAPTTGTLYIATGGDGNVMAIDIATRQVLASTHVGTSPAALALTPDENFLVVADSGASSLAILRTDPASLVATVPVGAGPSAVVVPGWLRKQ